MNSNCKLFTVPAMELFTDLIFPYIFVYTCTKKYQQFSFVLFDILNKHQRHSYLFGCDIYRLMWLFFAVFFEPKRYKVFVYQENHVNTKPAPFLPHSPQNLLLLNVFFFLLFFLLVEFLSCSLLRHELDTGVWITHRKSLKKHFHMVCLDTLVVLR